MQNGEIIEQGTHDELVETEGLYAKLWTTTYSSFDDIAANADTLVASPTESAT